MADNKFEYSGNLTVRRLLTKLKTALSGYAKQSEVDDLSEAVDGCVKTINNAAPDENGNVDVVVSIEPPQIVSSVDEMTDPTKQYVLDGYIWHYKTVTVPGSETSPNLFTPAEDKLNLRLSGTTGSASASDGSFVTDFISVMGDSGENLLVNNTPFTVRLNKTAVLTGQSKAVFYNGTTRVGANILRSDTNTTITDGTTVSDIKTQGDSTSVLPTDWTKVTNIKMQYQLSTSALVLDDIADCEVTFDAKKVVTESETVTGFVNSGVVYSQGADAADVAALKTDVETLKTDVEGIKTDVEGIKTDVEALKESSGGTVSSQSDTVLYAIGDSITAGLYAGGTEKSWVAHVINYNGYSASSKNLGVSGIGFVREDPTNAYTIRDIVDANSFANVNLVTVAVGINDWQQSCDIATVKTEMEYCFSKILTDNPYCKIFFITPLNKNRGEQATNWALGFEVNGLTLEEFVAEQVSVCESIGIEVIDMTHNSVINKYNLTSVLYDNTHPDETCHIALGKELARKITFV